MSKFEERFANRAAGVKGFVSVHRSVARTHVIRIGHTSIPPEAEQLEDHTGERWTLEYYALVDNVDDAFRSASSFLKPYSLHTNDDHSASSGENLYTTHPVIAATAIETSGINIRFRRSLFESLHTDTSAQKKAVLGGYPSDRTLRTTLEKSVSRRERVDNIVSEIDSIEQVLDYSERVTTRPTITSSTVDAKPKLNQKPVVNVTDPQPQPEIPVLFRDTEPETLVQIEGPDSESVKRMEQLILRREAAQNLRRIRISYLMSFLQGIPLGAALGFGALMALNLPNDQETLIRFVIAGTVALPVMLLGYRLARNWSDASHWRAILKT